MTYTEANQSIFILFFRSIVGLPRDFLATILYESYVSCPIYMSNHRNLFNFKYPNDITSV